MLAYLLALPVTLVVLFSLYLLFCVFVVVRTGKSESLLDVAEAMRGFAAISASLWRRG